MKRFLIVLATVLVLAGCASSARGAEIVVKPEIQSINTTVSFIESVRVVHNEKRMASVIRQLKSRIGRTWYVFSGASPSGWDCSGLTMWAYEQLGIKLPHSASKQGKVGRVVSVPRVGDLVLFGHGKSIYHASMYVGGGNVIHAGFRKGTTTQIIAINSPAFAHSSVKFVRVFG